MTDIEIGRRFCNIRQISSARTDAELADLGAAVRLAARTGDMRKIHPLDDSLDMRDLVSVVQG
jgi:hypothetical protein